MDSIQVLEHYGLLDENTEIGNDLNIKINCPFHDEQIESLNFNLNKDIFFCFGCGAKGDIIDFVQELEDINRLEAMQRVKQMSNGGAKKKDEIRKILKSKQKDKEELRKRAKKYYMSINSKRNDEALEYLYNRGINNKTINQFGIKFNNRSQYPIIIPLFDKSTFKGYIQRRIDDGIPKYLYNKGFEKKQTVVGKVRNSSPVIIVEGVFDLLKAYQFGYKNVASILGWKASKYQKSKIAKADKIIDGLDNDRAGKEGGKFLRDNFDNVVRLQYYKDRKDIGDMSEKEFNWTIGKTLDKF